MDIARGAAFCLLRSVWGCMVFFAFAFGVCGECCYGPERFFLGGCQYGYRGDAGFCAGFGVRWCRLSEVPLTEVKSKETTKKMHKNENTQNSHSFLALAFLGGICLGRHRRIWDRRRVLRFFVPVLVFFGREDFWVLVALFACFGCGCGGGCAFSGIWRRVESCFFPVSV